MQEIIIHIKQETLDINLNILDLLGDLGYRWQTGDICSRENNYWTCEYLWINTGRRRISHSDDVKQDSYGLSYNTFLKEYKNFLWRYEWIRNNKLALKKFLENYEYIVIAYLIISKEDLLLVRKE